MTPAYPHSVQDAPDVTGRENPSVLQEINTSLEQHPLSNSQLLRCLSAGWALQNDMCFVVPVLTAMEEARQQCHATLARRVGSNLGARLETTNNRGPHHEALEIWRKELQLENDGSTSSLPTFALYFIDQCTNACSESDISNIAGFLLVSELVVARIGKALCDGLQKAQLPAPTATHANSLEDIGLIEEIFFHYAQDSQFGETFRSTVKKALSLHHRFLEDIYQGMRTARTASLADKIQARLSLERSEEPAIAMYPGIGEIMFEETDDKRGIQFTVERYPCTAETLDPRVVRIPPGKTNNLHKHAHETLFYFIDGIGEILVGEKWVPVKSGDAVFAPRWSMHQTRNTGATELVLLAITDYYLTSTVYVGKYDKI